MATFDAILRIGAQTTGTGEIKALQGALGGLSTTAATVRTALGGLTGLGAAIGAGLGAAGLAAAGKGIIDMADSLDELSQRTGTSVEMLSKLGLAARQSGLDTEQVSGAMVKLSKNLGAIATGGGEKAAAALSALGISATDATGNLKTADQVLLEVADRFQALPDGVMKTKTAMDLFGKSGAALIPMLNMGSDAIEDLNTGMSGEFAKNAGIYNDQLANLQAQASALGATVLEALLPSLIKVTSFTATAVESMAGWVRENRQTIIAFVTGIGETIKAFAPFGAVILGAAAAWGTYRKAMQLASAAQVLFMRLTPVGVVALGTSLAVGAVIAGQVALKMKEIDDKAKAAGLSTEDFSKAIADAGLASDELLGKLKAQEDPLEKNKELSKEQAQWLKEQNKLYDEQVAKVAASYQRQQSITANLVKGVESRTKAAEDILSVEQAQIGVAKAYLDNRLAVAKTDYERRQITLEIIELERKGAQAQYAATIAQIQGERELANLRIIEAENRFRQAIEELRIARELGVETAQIRANVEAARSGLKATAVETVAQDRSLSAREKVANLNLEAANITLNGRVSQTDTRPGFNQWGNVFEIHSTQISGGIVPQFANGGYVTSRTLAEIGEGGEPEYVVPESKVKGFAANILGGSVGKSAISSAKSNEGGYVKDKYGVKWSTNPEDYRGKTWNITAYDTDESVGSPRWQIKMAQSAQLNNIKLARSRASVGGGGGSTSLQRMPTIMIKTGPVQRRSDGDSVTMSDLEKAVASAVQQTLADVSKNSRQPSVKRRTGVR